MMRLASIVAFLVHFLLGLGEANSAPTFRLNDWPIGEERETRPGTYTSVVAKSDGWITILKEDADSAECNTVKVGGGTSPLLIEGHILLVEGAYAEIARDFEDGALKWTISGPLSDGTAQYRLSGERYLKDVDGAIEVDGASIDYVWEGWKYPNTYRGHIRYEGDLDMTGLVNAIARHDQLCPPDRLWVIHQKLKELRGE